MLKIKLNRHNIFHSTQLYFILLVAPLRINEGKNTFTISVVPWNCEKVLSNFQNLTI